MTPTRNKREKIKMPWNPMMRASRQNTHLDLIRASKPHRRDPSARADGGECEQISLWMREGMDERETLEREDEEMK